MDKNWLFRRPISVLRTTLWRSPRSGSTRTAPSSGSQHHHNDRKKRLIWIHLILYVGTAPGRTMTFTVGWTFTCSQWTPRQDFCLLEVFHDCCRLPGVQSADLLLWILCEGLHPEVTKSLPYNLLLISTLPPGGLTNPWPGRSCLFLISSYFSKDIFFSGEREHQAAPV